MSDGDPPPAQREGPHPGYDRSRNYLDRVFDLVERIICTPGAGPVVKLVVVALTFALIWWVVHLQPATVSLAPPARTAPVVTELPSIPGITE